MLINIPNLYLIPDLFFLPASIPILLLFILGRGRECKLWPSHCLSSLQSTITFHCPSKGRFIHPLDCTRYLKCISQDFLACDCQCKPGQEYNHAVHSCVPTMLRDVKCRSLVKPTHIPTSIHVPTKPTIYSGYTIPTISTDYEENTAHNRSRYHSHQESTSQHTYIVEDNSAVPAWLISFLVLLAVIVLITIVLALY